MSRKFLSLAATALAAGSTAWAANCFPYGDAQLPGNLAAPNVTLDDWWCPQSMVYGFQGFSFPMEDDNCDDYTVDSLSAEFAQMKRDFGATVVRMYYPVCTEAKIFGNAVEAAYANNMGLVFQVWTNFGKGDTWKQSQQAIFDTLDDPKYAKVAPYVVHYAEFGSEPVGDGLDGAGDGDGAQFVQDLANFRTKMNSYGILVGISDDWDRPGKLSSDDGSTLGPVGEGVQKNSDIAHIHPMPFYHFNDPESEAWAYIQQATQFVLDNVKLPTVISETQWAWGWTQHNPDKTDLGVDQYTNYWKTFDDNCEWFKEKNVGWFLHAWKGEDTFDIVYDDGSYVIPDWKPRKC